MMLVQLGETPVLGNRLVDWVIALGAAVGATVLIVLGRRLVSRRLAALAQRTDTAADDALVEAVRSIRKTYVLLITVGIALMWLDLPDLAHSVIKRVLVLVAVLQGIRSGNAIVEFWVTHYAARRDGLDRTTLRALSYAGRVVLWITIILIGLEAAGLEAKTLLTGLGVGGIAIALAVQNVLGDLFAALSIVLDKPFVVGDSIAVDTFEGDVVHIGLKSTRVRSVNGEEVVFANADLLRSRLRNLTRREGRRYVISLVLAPGTTVAQLARVPAIVAESVTADGRATLQRSHLTSLHIQGPEVESAILVPGPDWVAAYDIRQAVLLGVLSGLEREGIALARPAYITSGVASGVAA